MRGRDEPVRTSGPGQHLGVDDEGAEHATVANLVAKQLEARDDGARILKREHQSLFFSVPFLHASHEDFEERVKGERAAVVRGVGDDRNGVDVFLTLHFFRQVLTCAQGRLLARSLIRSRNYGITTHACGA